MARKPKNTNGTTAVYLRGPDMAARGYASTTAYRHVEQGLLPPPVNLGPKASGWPLAEIELIEAARAVGCGDIEIRALVARLLAERQARFARLAKAVGVSRGDLRRRDGQSAESTTAVL